MSNYRVHTSIASAQAVLSVGERLVSAKWKQTKNQTAMERAVIVPFECLVAPEVPESFRALVESCLQEAASESLKKFVGENEAAHEIPAELFTREALTEAFMSRADTWMSKEALEIAFTGSATWKRIVSREEFKSNATYQRAANAFKDAILKLSGKATVLPPAMRDAILAKMEESDLGSEFGVFVTKRIEAMSRKDSGEIDLSAL